MKTRVTIIAAAAATGFAVAAHAAQPEPKQAGGDQKYTMEKFKTDAKAVGKGAKDAAVDVGHQIGSGAKKAYREDAAKIKKDAKTVKANAAGNGSAAEKDDGKPAAGERK